MNEEKMLAKVKRKNIFEKIFDYIKMKLFNKKGTSKLNDKTYLNNNNFIKEMEENRKILNTQKSLECGEIKEIDLTEKEKNDLIKLYSEQISNLKKDIKIYNTTLKSYKEKILAIKSKLND